MNRRTARRHKGSHRMASRITPDPSWREAKRQDAIEWLCWEQAADALRYWTSTLAHPLFVYFIQADSGQGPVKIGQAEDPIKRVRELQCGNWHPLTIRALILADDQREQRLHHQWKDAAIRGEWFGNGYEHAIIAAAEHASLEQVRAHQAGADVRTIHAIVTTAALDVTRRLETA